MVTGKATKNPILLTNQPQWRFPMPLSDAKQTTKVRTKKCQSREACDFHFMPRDGKEIGERFCALLT